MTIEEESVVAKVRELMSTLDRARQYRAIAASLVDFLLVLLSSVVVAALMYLTITYLLYAYGLDFGTSLIPSFLSLGALLVVIAGLLGGLLIADRRVKRVKVGQWEEDLKEGFPGAFKILTNFDWNSAIYEVQTAKLGFILYGVLKVVGYTLVLSILLSAGVLGLASGIVHFAYTPAFVPVLSFIIVIAASSADLKRRFAESFSLDSLLWELRWFYTGFARSEFEA